MDSKISKLVILNVHGPNRKADHFFSRLGTAINNLKQIKNILVAGDFNSQLGQVHRETYEASLIGKFVGHDNFNENGCQMRMFLNLYNLAARTTQANASFKYTWSNRSCRSQIDHLLTHTQSNLFLRRMQCTRPCSVATDHMALFCNIVRNRCSKQQTMNIRAYSRPDVDVSLLRNPSVQKNFKDRLTTDEMEISTVSVEEMWTGIRDKIRKASLKTLQRTSRLPPHRECRLALAQVKKFSFWVNRSENPKWKYKLEEAREQLTKRLRAYEEKQIAEFFKSLHNYPSGERINRTYKYLKRFKKKMSVRKTKPNLTLKDWVPSMILPSQIPNLLPEQQSVDPILPPTLLEIQDILAQMKNGKSPGVDGLYTEFYKYSDEKTIQDLHALLVKVWETNQLPEEWKQSVVVPIPKVRNPRTINDYRPISLSCTAYKIYASWILKKLQQTICPIGLHQAAFLPGRSTMDHVHVLQRIVQEKWNEGTSLVLMSLDIEKAFDHVSLLALPAILKGKREKEKKNNKKI